MPPPNGNGDAADIIKRSVTARDYNESPTAGGVFHFLIPAYGSDQVDLPPFWSFARDYVLASTLYRESMWAAALRIAIAKIVSQGFDVESEVPLRAKRAQDMLLNFDTGRGYVSGLQKHLQNFLLTGNGAHVEIVRASRALGSRIIGLVPLDTFRCVRTGDPDYPIIYRDRFGGEHIMREWDVFSMADMPDPADTMFGVGHCAAEAAYTSIIKLEAIERYVREKVTGQRALALDFVSGVTSQNLLDAKAASQAEAQAKGVVTYMGSTLVAMAGDVPVQHVRVNLAELPDGFGRKEEWDMALNTYARSLGIAVQELQPLSGQGLGTGTQSVVLDEAAKGQGLAAWRQQWEHNVNRYCLDEKTTYAILTNDIRDREREAKVRIDEAAAIETWTRMGISAEQAISLGVDRDQLPEEYRPADLTAGTQLSDDEKLDQVEAEQEDEQAEGVQEPPDELEEDLESAPVVKAARHDADPTDRELLAVLKQLADAAAQPAPAPVPPATIHVEPTPVQIPPPRVLKDPQTTKALAAVSDGMGRLAERVDHLARDVSQPRGYRVKRRDANGRILEWEEA